MRNLVLDFILHFVTVYMRKYPIHVKSVQGQHKIHYTAFEEKSKKTFMTNTFITTVTTHEKCSK